MLIRKNDAHSPSRRAFLKGAATTTATFVLGTFVPFGRFALAEGEAAAPPRSPRPWLVRRSGVRRL